MAYNRKIHMPLTGPMLDRLRMGGPKTAVAGVLILILLFMWIRVFVGHRPAAATGAPQSQPAEAAKPPVRITRIELPRIAGRHDSLQEDFFIRHDHTDARRNPAGRDTGTDEEVSVTSSRIAQEVIQRVARTLKLEAVLWSEDPRAFINDQLLRVGGKLIVKDGPVFLEFEVLRIHVNSVLVECGGLQLTLELAQFLEVVH
jgi:hypothetical protein